jgi:undecaprenyl-diphosphatase
MSRRTATATVVAHVFSWLGSGYVVFPLAVGFCVTMYRRAPVRALAIGLSTAGAVLVANVDKVLVGRPRPPVRHLDHVVGSSFPSGHATQSTVLCVVLVLTLFSVHPGRALMIAAVAAGTALVICIAISRVYLGVHYPSDVVAGIGLGLSWALIVTSASRQSFRRRESRSSGGIPASIGSCKPP